MKHDENTSGETVAAYTRHAEHAYALGEAAERAAKRADEYRRRARAHEDEAATAYDERLADARRALAAETLGAAREAARQAAYLAEQARTATGEALGEAEYHRREAERAEVAHDEAERAAERAEDAAETAAEVVAS